MNKYAYNYMYRFACLSGRRVQYEGYDNKRKNL
jgi:hypothetical protein